MSRVFQEIEDADKSQRSHLKELKMLTEIRKRISDFYFGWGASFSLENYKGLWKDALALSICYYPFNIRSWYYYLTGFFTIFYSFSFYGRMFYHLCRK